MQCKKCGSVLLDNAEFCTNCGEHVSVIDSQNPNTINNPNNVMQDASNTIEGVNTNNGVQNTGNNIGVGNQINNNMNNQPNQNNKGKKKTGFIILAVIGVCLIVPIILVVGIFSLVSATSEKLVCKSREGNITIYYTKSSINGYKASGIDYDLDQQKEVASQIGIDEYIREFNIWFTTNTTGSCTINGKNIEQKK